MSARRNGHGGFTGVDLVMILSSISLFLAVSTPPYRDHLIRTKVGECIQASALPKLIIEDFHASYGRWPRSELEAGIGNEEERLGSSLSPYCSSFGYAVEGSGTGIFKIVINTAAVDESLVGAQIAPTMVPIHDSTGALAWYCHSGDTDPGYRQYLPLRCRETLEEML